MKIRLGKLVIMWGDACSREECDYYTHYLRYGPPTMSHAAYHKALGECLDWQEIAMGYQDRDEEIPTWVERMCQKLETEVRV